MPYVEDPNEGQGGLLDSDSDSNSDNAIKINKKFARDWESKKRREELSNARQDGINVDEDYSSSSSESEDEDAELLTPGVDLKVLETINRIRAKDPSIYDSSTDFFKDVVPKVDRKAGGESKKMAYKDVVREQILEEMASNDEKKTSAVTTTSKSRLAYDAEQESNRQAFLSEFKDDDEDGSDSDGDVLSKKKAVEMSISEQEHEKRMQEEFEKMKGLNTAASPMRDPKGEVADGEDFLREFSMKRKWVDEATTFDPKKDIQEIDEEEEELDRVDNFESKYNFRFEEEGGGQIINYSRTNADTMRKTDDKRKKEREARRERKALERKKKEEQLAHLKNQKKAEIKNQMEKIKDIGGLGGADMDEELMAKMMEGDFDPDEFENAMQKAYGDNFYDDEDEHWKSLGDVKADLAKDDEVEFDYDEVDEGEGDDDEEGAEGGDQSDSDSSSAPSSSSDEEEEKPSTSTSEKLTAAKKKTSELVDELYKLDYEDIIGDMPTRFKYKTVEKNDYGLAAEDILAADDNELNGYVSLKKLAAYRDPGTEFRVHGNKRRKFKDSLKDKKRKLEAEEEKAKLQKEAERVEKLKKQEDNLAPGGRAGAGDGDEGDGGEGGKKKRKKRGKKKKKGENGGDGGDGETPADNGDNEPEPERTEPKKNQQKVEQTEKHEPKKKRGKKKKSKTVVEGVSSDRLAAYGL
ncbi:hypothetical protein TrLO_g4024 [Triparma laevis f. longispina]|uniref:Kri1-like C-terminal domain-containing protein n=1 Tax=Triparma laevis f. longispina TaxID=1714387 RepID=A0A9W7AR34_9STRA|nr:hypothetical protein TrLO_g4024 [Triparma laevis f. longispina]